jgi:hypothetical protein
VTAPADQFVEIANRAQEAVTAAFRAWGETIQTLTAGFAEGAPALPAAPILVDRYFDLAQQALDAQRQFAQGVVAACTQAAETVAEQTTKATESVTAQTISATEAAASKIAEVTKAAGEQAASTVRAARNGVKV